jgi:hypothetical protein
MPAGRIVALRANGQQFILEKRINLFEQIVSRFGITISSA